MPGNFDGIKNRKFGIEIEMTGITRCEAAKAIKKVLGGDIDHVGGTYDKYTVVDDKGRKWQIVFDSSIYARKKNGDLASDYYKVELNSPVLEYEDFDLLQSVIRALRKAGAITGPDYDCGTHIHIDASDYTPQQIRNLVNLWSSIICNQQYSVLKILLLFFLMGTFDQSAPMRTVLPKINSNILLIFMQL